ncbi:hypothetical protein Q8A67_005494 [Cirrhinus molitorella]|uniref:AIG1-type G domain-containing protein n=1 Tax=Cirrhinus molitorella TaxID=172907 RepID=A0AA88QAS0_9TELE|nr:hypothetical protein Q8A67_005494 [Cirrhinus molitorella]
MADQAASESENSSSTMSNKDQRDNISSVSDQTKVQNVQTNRSNYDVTLMNPGPPALYQLNTERKYFVETDKKVRQWTYGRRDRNKQNKVILMVGETGAGKTTMINTMVNYLLGVKFEDEEFYQITEEKENQDQTQSQTSEITVYEVFVEENPTSLTIIDTPGYGDNEGYEKDIEISKYLMKLFSDEEGIRYIDAVCFVIKASVNRLSGKEHYIFHSVLSLFGKDIEENIVFLFTHSDGGRPRDALSAIKKAEIPSRKDEDNQPVYFLFSNRQKEERDEESKHSDRSVWEMGERSINRFLTSLEEKNRKSVKMTLDVLKERRQLEACVSNLMERIYEKELQSEELEQIQEALKKNKDKIEKDENFDFKVKKVFKEKVPIVNEWWWNSKATCCSKFPECNKLNLVACGSDKISLVELPALFNTQLSEEEVMRQTHRCVSLCHPGVHVFIIIIPDAPLNNEDRAEIEEIQRIFSSRINKHIMILIKQNSEHQTAELNEETQKKSREREEERKKHEEEKERMKMMMDEERQNHEKERKRREDYNQRLKQEEESMKINRIRTKRERREEELKREIREQEKHQIEIRDETRTRDVQTRKTANENVKKEKEKLQIKYDTKREILMNRIENDRKKREEEYKTPMKVREDLQSKHEAEENKMKILMEKLNREREELMQKHKEEKERMKMNSESKKNNIKEK